MSESDSSQNKVGNVCQLLTGHILIRSCIVWRGWRGRRRGRSSQLPAELPAAEEEVLGGNIRQRHLGRPQPEPEPGDQRGRLLGNRLSCQTRGREEDTGGLVSDRFVPGMD